MRDGLSARLTEVFLSEDKLNLEDMEIIIRDFFGIKLLDYDVQGADELAGLKLHPQMEINKLALQFGFVVLDGCPDLFSGSWTFWVVGLKLDTELPNFLKIIEEEKDGTGEIIT
jgi:hypothetical protein